MKSRVIVLIFLIAIFVAWIAAGFWAYLPEKGGGSSAGGGTSPPSHDLEQSLPPETTPGSGANPDNSDTPLPTPKETPEQIADRREAMLKQAEALYLGYFYDEALSLLREDEKLINDDTEHLEAKIEDARESLVLYTGEIRHIFFHSAIIYPERLERDGWRIGATEKTGFPNSRMPTQSEVYKMLPQLMERGYVLYDITDVFSKGADGKMRQNDIYLPPGKMPLLVSFDDPSYHYNRARNIGFADRLVLDENGDVATEVTTPSGENIITNDGDVFLIIDNFVNENPEFSWRGAKGVIASTGYIGVFGYDVEENPDTIPIATAIADKIKENGWKFASHSFTHNTGVNTSRGVFWGPGSNPEAIRYDTRRWNEVVRPILGKTNIFIAPGGYVLPTASMQVLIDDGYDIYCSVAIDTSTGAQPLDIRDDIIVQGRLEIAGYAYTYWSDILDRDFFIVAEVIDPLRPPALPD
ncbi:MAG: hypothetical protein FWH17_02965 [Oscillospiraceae bacterium]|nr:hypothetical protein [Oscillospiraceae bacterium]